MPDSPLNVALVGCGIFGEIHAATYRDFEHANLVAVCDIDESRAKGFARKYGGRATTSVEGIAADPDVQAVSVATPDFAHREVCEAIVAAGKHLLVEKPLATTVADARAICRAVEKAGVLGMVDFHNRYHPGLVPIKQRLDAGDMGRPLMLYARLSDRLEVATEWFGWSGRSGPEWFLGSHLADLACWLMGAYPTRVYAQGRKDVLRKRGIGCYDAVQMSLTFPEGFATLETSWIVPQEWPMLVDFVVSLQATEGRGDMTFGDQGSQLAAGGTYGRPMLSGKEPAGPDEFGFLSLPIRRFVRAVLAEAESPMPLEWGLRNVQILAAAGESLDTGQVVEIVY